MQEGEKNSGRGFFVFRLDDDGADRSLCNLPTDIWKNKMIPIDDRKHVRGWGQSFGAIKGMLKHRTTADNIDVLLGQQILTEEMNERAKAFPLAAREHECVWERFLSGAI
jgi:hypothetical protein